MGVKWKKVNESGGKNLYYEWLLINSLRSYLVKVNELIRIFLLTNNRNFMVGVD